MNKNLRDLGGIVIVAIAIWASFTYFSTTTDKKDLVSLEQEADIADYFNRQIFNEFDSVDAELTDPTMNVILNRLSKGMDTVSYEYDIYVLKSDQVNAFTAFNGQLFVFTGLIEQTESAEELAAVLAHELAHAENRHVIKNLVKEIGLNSLILIISGGDPLVMQEITKMVVSSGFNRSMEREADEYAIKYLREANINPNRLTQFFLKLKQKNREIPDGLQWISSHPALTERIQFVSENAGDSLNEDSINLDWNEFKKSLK
ncbi:M48 family metallopeptidase [Marivirga salinae]|uniref:M48 family metallopeptidase n=1 Tax=Marivirga salinarum TaxID=3059078 RepID=A0AA51R940_9BACT|nr:M48 family metallopeptidase [Marivirga sp. BDSF4-3]WMN11867.1 M48 family metallopeptidase [Marivirga sp. BDSF4-3]